MKEVSEIFKMIDQIKNGELLNDETNQNEIKRRLKPIIKCIKKEISLDKKKNKHNQIVDLLKLIHSQYSNELNDEKKLLLNNKSTDTNDLNECKVEKKPSWNNDTKIDPSLWQYNFIDTSNCYKLKKHCKQTKLKKYSKKKEKKIDDKERVKKIYNEECKKSTENLNDKENYFIKNNQLRFSDAVAYASDRILKNLIHDITKELYLYIDYCCKDIFDKEFKYYLKKI